MKITKLNWGKTLFPLMLVIAVATLVILPFVNLHGANRTGPKPTPTPKPTPKPRVVPTPTPTPTASQVTTPTPTPFPMICTAKAAIGDACLANCFQGFAVYLPGVDPTRPENDCVNQDGHIFVFSPPATFTENFNGTATLIGHLESMTHPGEGFDIVVSFTGRTNTAAPMSPHLELNPNCYAPTGPVDPSTWHYYTNYTGTFTGTGAYAGGSLNITPFMANFQVGNGANGKNIKPGASGWFVWNVTSQPTTGRTLQSGGENVGRTGDFNFECCTGVIGDFVWQDNNQNGCQDPGEPGISNVQVELFTGCDGEGVLVKSTTTNSEGKYQFGGLCAGQYTVRFHTPSGFTHTLSNQACNVGGKPPDETDSDCECSGTTTPCDVCVTLPTDNTENLTIDCGYFSPCALTVTKSCVIPTPTPGGSFDCSKLKPIDSLSMTWTGSQPVKIIAHRGDTSKQALPAQNVNPGQTITISGFAGSPNDLIWEIFNAAGTTKLGESTFHISCSDPDMDGPEDCGKVEGDGKGKTGFITTWTFAGMAGNGQAINCAAASPSPSTGCTIPPGPPANCDTVGKPTSLTFRYTGGGCAASNNPQSGKFVCSGSVNTALPITVSNSNGYTISPTTVNPGETFTVTASGGFKAQSNFTLSNAGGTETLSIHTSCSQLLEVGNVFGDLTLVGFNGQTGGGSIVYHYEVKNTGGSPLTNVTLTDDKVGQIAGPFNLAAGETKTFDFPTQVNQTTTNTATATAQGQNCSATSNSVTVTVQPTPTPTPTPQQGNCTTNGKPNKLTMTYTGGSCASAMNSQGPPNFSTCQKYCCTEMNGGLTGVTPVRIVVSNSATVPGPSTQKYFDGMVAIGGQFDVFANSSQFSSNTYFFIFEGGVLKQKVQMHTSCSAPLIRGETFGGVRLDDYAIVP